MEVQKTDVDCPVCKIQDFKILYEAWNKQITDPKTLYGAASGVRGTQRIVRCQGCEMVYENPQYPESIILEGYASSDESGHDSQYPMRVESFYRALKRLQKYIPQAPAHVLDIGTAGGAFLDAAERYGYDPVGLEPSQFLTDQGEKRGLNIRCGTIENHPFKPKTFDMISMWDVIEHVVDPQKSLSLIRPLLKDDGILLLNYPDFGTTQAKIAGEKFWWLLSGHLHYFTRKTIGELLERSGYQVVTYKRYWQTLQFGYLEDVAEKLRVPLAGVINKLTPNKIKTLPLSYYASQTTVIARLK